MSPQEMCTPSKKQLVLAPMSGGRDTQNNDIPAQPPRTGTSSDGLKSLGDVISTSSASAESSTSSAESVAFVGRLNAKELPVTPSQGQSNDLKHQTTLQHAETVSTKKICRSMPAALLSSSQNLNQSQHDCSNGSPQSLASRRLSQVQALTGLEDAHAMHRRHSIAAFQPLVISARSSRSIGSTLPTPTMQHSPHGASTDSMTGVPEPLAVQELAFRQGQHDASSSRDRIPSSPFPQHFNNMWAESYMRGRAYGNTPFHQSYNADPSHQNFTWAVLINPYTQDFEHPNGVLDLEWARKICEIGLNCMEALIRVVCERRSEWQKITCDIPTPVQHAINNFPDLIERYEKLKRDAREALGGGRPFGS